MNHNVTLAIVAIVAAMTLTAVAFAIPQQALAYKHHHNHNNHKNSIKVDQQINQENACTGAPLEVPRLLDGTGSSTVCLNQGDNSADIHR
ncbi:MAG TPA: hypothetical protein VFI73_11620 [Candidatus Nitrosopolaris sp.]|nr:hypothetical protein [Candidatus Nitrosopolaris sp.]